MSPEAPGNLVVIDLKFEGNELKGVIQSVEYPPEETETVEATGYWFSVLWNTEAVGDEITPIGGGVVSIQELPDGYTISQPQPTTIIRLENGYAYRYYAQGEGLMFVLILPEGFTLSNTRVMPRSAKIFDEKRLAVYWKPEGGYRSDVKVIWGLKKYRGSINKECERINTEIYSAEDVPNNPGVIVDHGKENSEIPLNFEAAVVRTLWKIHPTLRTILISIAVVIVAMFSLWATLPDSIKQNIIDAITGH